MKIIKFLMIIYVLSTCFISRTIATNVIQVNQVSEQEMINNLIIGLKQILMNNKALKDQYQRFNKSDISYMYKSTISFDTYKLRLHNFLSSLINNDHTTKGFVIINLGGGFNGGKVQKLSTKILVEKLSSRYIEETIMQEDILETLDDVLINKTLMKMNYETFINKYPKSDAMPNSNYEEYEKNLNILAKKLSINRDTIDGLIMPSVKDMFPGGTNNPNWSADVIEYHMFEVVAHRQFLEGINFMFNNKSVAQGKYKEYKDSYSTSSGVPFLKFDGYVKRLKSTEKSMRKFSTSSEWLINNTENIPTIDDLSQFIPGFDELQDLMVDTNTFLKGLKTVLEAVGKIAGWVKGFIMQILNWISIIYTGECFECDSQDCNSVLNCVMKQQRATLLARLDDLKTTIQANTKQTKHQTKIIKKELDHYVALLERIKKENAILKKALFLSKKIKNSESLGVQINAIEKGK